MMSGIAKRKGGRGRRQHQPDKAAKACMVIFLARGTCIQASNDHRRRPEYKESTDRRSEFGLKPEFSLNCVDPTVAGDGK
jgi:hypothetical protein